jgi:hypothetical protein
MRLSTTYMTAVNEEEETTMRIVMSALVALSIVAGIAAPLSAQETSPYYRHQQDPGRSSPQ